MKRICLLFAAFLLAALWAQPVFHALAFEEDPGEAAVYFVESLAEGGWDRAPDLCTDPKDMEGWTPPFVTRYLVFPSISDVLVADVQESGGTAAVTLLITAMDLAAADEDGYPLMDQFVSELNIQDLYAPETMLGDAAIVSLLRGANGLMDSARRHTNQFEVPYILRRVDGEWKIDLKATVAGWGIGGVSVTPISYGTLSYDYAQRRYYALDAYYDRRLTLPGTLTWENWLREITAEEIFAAAGKPVWNIWLRLAAQGDAEGLYGFSVSPSPAACETLPVHFYEFGFMVEQKYWAFIGGRQRGVLEVSLPVNPGEPITGYTVSARRRVHILTPMYAEDTISFALDGVPYETLCPEGGVSFTVAHFMRVKPVVKEQYGKTLTAGTLGELMAEEFDGGHNDSVFPDAPEGIGGLPVINGTYALYRLQGTMEKARGDFGVYDVTFALSSPMDGVWVEAYEQCSFCDAIDGFDMMGAESTCRETLRQAFDVQVLVRIDGRSDEDLEAFIRGLALTATFSCEEWDFCYEEHGTTTRIGPRTTVNIDTSQMACWPGAVSGLPIAEYVSADPGETPGPDSTR